MHCLTFYNSIIDLEKHVEDEISKLPKPAKISSGLFYYQKMIQMDSFHK